MRLLKIFLISLDLIRYTGSGINAKAVMFYLTNYITKGNLSLANLVTVCISALEKYIALQDAQVSLIAQSMHIKSAKNYLVYRGKIKQWNEPEGPLSSA